METAAPGCARAHGKVLEVAVGSGRNLPLYPAGVEVTAVDISESMLDLTRARAKSISRDVDTRLADAEQLPFDDESFDTVMCTLSMCSIPDDQRAREMWRALRPGGSLLLLAHVRSHTRLGLMIQRQLERMR